jgi:hypothetical protein
LGDASAKWGNSHLGSASLIGHIGLPGGGRQPAAEDLVRSFSGEAGDSCYKTMPTANAGKIVKNHRCPHCDASYNSFLCTKTNLTQFRAVRAPRTT